ncbi:MAG: Holliday junction resolvase RuvX [Candidatus Babeliales bacterium]|nr:Holliday junction resolvase RuvX [Candidatus Babeliales bacterium]
MKTLALDLGDVHVGTAISDVLGITAKPYLTVGATELESFLKALLEKESNITTIVVGLPKTMRGTISEQTQKTIDTKEDLEKKFPQIKWVLLDERLTSKQADQMKQAKTKEDKIKSHSVAAALILRSYLDSVAFFKS